MSDPDATTVIIGRIVKPHGLVGEVAVISLTDVPDRFAAGTVVWVGAEAMTVTGSRPHQGRLLVRFEEVGDRTSAERLRGREVRAEPVDHEGSETFFVHELVGALVRDEADRPLGEVTAWIELPAAAGYDLLEVRREDGSSWLLPAVDEYVEVEEDTEGLLLRVIAAPEGLVHGEADEVREADPNGTDTDGVDGPGSS